MQIEYEATFANIDKDAIRNKLKEAGAKLEKAEFMQRRSVYHLPEGNHIAGGWMRVRDEGDKITMSVKTIDGKEIQNQKESCLTVDSYEEAETFLQTIGCKRKAYQETLRELWLLDEVEVTIDTWPFLEPFIEVEGTSEEAVKAVSVKLGMDWSKAIFAAVDVLYSGKYGVPTEVINDQTPLITFEMENPFI
ncbi:CYTH domain-containing protein [Candidatus Nomurabacteria bacterium]|nr:CYTH domain-containing protein [Candidatus Kaiserbacteria bacterium]MCB9815492.1 CYTH domain-containing protein [Candidatus Nomurabacteria bacterium]